MRILFATNGFPPRHNAGTENYTAGIATALANAGHVVQVVCAGDWDSGPHNLNGVSREANEPVAVIRLNLNWTRGPDPNRWLYDNPLVEAAFDQPLADFQPDVVHVTSCYTLSASILRAVKKRSLPLVVTLTDFWFLCPRVNLLHASGSVCNGQTTAWDCLSCMLAGSTAARVSAALPAPARQAALTWLSQQPAMSRQRGLRGMALDMRHRKSVLPELLSLADRVIAPSQTLANTYRAAGLHAATRVIHYGHDLAWAANFADKPRLVPLVLGFVGRIAHEKGLHVLAEAAAMLPPDLPIRIDVWGDAAQDAAYAAEIQRPGRAAGIALNLRGPFNRSQLEQVYGELDAVVVPSIWLENNPLVIQEAFAARRPVIASNLGGMAEFVEHEVSGLLVEPGDPAALAAAIMRLAVEPDLLARLRARVPSVRTIDQEVATLSALYAEVLAKTHAV